MKAYNLDKVVSVQLNDFYPARSYRYKPELRFLGIRFRKEGFYCAFWNSYISAEIPDNHSIRDGELFENPEVVIRFEDESRKTKYFEQYQDAKVFYDELIETGKWLVNK